MSVASLPLAANHAQQLAASAILESVIAVRGYRSIAPGAIVDAQTLVGAAFSKNLLKSILHQGALSFPIYRLGDATPYTWVLRPDLPRSTDDGKPIKYEYPRGVGNVLDVLPCYQAALADPTIPIWLTEGAKKADALASAYGTAVVPININGVWGWRGRNSAGGKTALPDFDLIAWEGRQVVIAPDGDVKENASVLHAVQRLGRLLTARYGVGDLQICYLPQTRGAPKLGVDDYFASGKTTAELEAHLVSLVTASNGARTSFGVHPDTGDKLFLPGGYDVRNQTVVQVDDQGKARNLYSGAIYVRETGTNLVSGEQSDTISWNGRGNYHGEVTVPHKALSSPSAFSELVSSAGAAIGPLNIKPVMQYLIEFTQENRDALPHRAYSDRLGLVQSGLVLPAGAIGFSQDVRYIGRPAIAIGSDMDAYPQAIRTMLGWSDAWPAWLALSLSLAGPAIARLKLRRNPALYLSGPSGSGKTTLAQFAIGCWGDPTRHPLRIEAGRTTPAGIFQTLEHLGGLPMLVDEAHTIPEPKRLEMAIYSFANGQRYTTGGVDGKARGGDPLAGTLLLAGEAIPEFKHAGSRLRVLWTDATAFPPLGAEARSSVGAARAQVLEQAWTAGAGLFGMLVSTALWGNWSQFTSDMQTLEADRALAPLGAWRSPLAAAAAVLQMVFRMFSITSAELPGGAAWVGQLLNQWATMLTASQGETDPAVDAWEALVTMLAQGRQRDNSEQDSTGQYVPATWEYIEGDRGAGVIACRRAGESYWRVLTNTPHFRGLVGEAAVQLYGQAWLKRGWIIPASDGKSTEVARIYPEHRVRVLKIPETVLTTWSA